MASVTAVCLQLALVATAIKLLLLLPTYRSTDFEVHRNWLAITHSLPISKWYVENTSEWTLDYPPFFAWFEWLLSQFARHVDPAMLVVQNLDYASPGTVAFQRCSVIVTDLVLLVAAYGLSRWVSSAATVSSIGGSNTGGSIGGSGSTSAAGTGAAAAAPAGPGAFRRAVVLFFLVSGNAGLLLVDHIHFQYNGFMMGVLLLSLHAALAGHHLLSGLLFAALLNLKHLFLYAAPVYFVYLLRHYCGEGLGGATTEDPRAVQGVSSKGGGGGGGIGGALVRLAVLGGGVLAIFGVSFGPFIAVGQMPQVLRRLFPFGRGLLHAYWAANAWAPYAAADKLQLLALPRLSARLGLNLAALGLRVEGGAANMAAGLVGVSRFAVLPQVTPAATAAAVLVALTPCLAALWAGDGRPKYVSRTLVRAVSYSYLCGFVFGYHVHEKAVLVALLPMALDAVRCPVAAHRFLLLSAAGHYGLLPLLFRPQEYAPKILIVLSYFVLSYLALGAVHAGSDESGGTSSDARGQGGDGVAPMGGAASAPSDEARCTASPVTVKAGGGSESKASGAVGGHLDTRHGGRLGGATARAERERRGTSLSPRRLLGPWTRCYLAGFIAIEVYGSAVHPLVPVLRERLPFVPLMLTSVYCSVGVLAVWVDMAVEWMGDVGVACRRR